MEAKHLPGCDLRHGSRQKCSSWQAPAPQEPALVDPQPTEQASASTATRIGCLLLAGIIGFPIAVVVSIVLAITLVLTGAFAADRAGLIDLDYRGYPGYLADAEPDGAELVERRYCCGGSLDGSGVTQFFYVHDQPFSDVGEHYSAEMAKHSFRRSDASAWFTDAPAVKFTSGDDTSICFTIVPFTPEYDLSDLAYRSVDVDRLRQRLLSSQHPYVVQFHKLCGG